MDNGPIIFGDTGVGATLRDLWGDLLFLGVFALLMLVVAGFTLRQEKL
jgi:hypothetical protein